jgi:transcriptional regulator with XRE-family HTH domain
MSAKTPDSIDRHIGSRLRMRRLALGISQEKLGDALGLTFQQVQKYEKGTNRVGGSRLLKLAELLEVDVGFFYMNLEGHVVRSGPRSDSDLADDGLQAFMATSEGLMIARAFVRIADPKVRHAVATSIARLSDALRPPDELAAAE